VAQGRRHHAPDRRGQPIAGPGSRALSRARPPANHRRFDGAPRVDLALESCLSRGGGHGDGPVRGAVGRCRRAGRDAQTARCQSRLGRGLHTLPLGRHRSRLDRDAVAAISGRAGPVAPEAGAGPRGEQRGGAAWPHLRRRSGEAGHLPPWPRAARSAMVQPGERPDQPRWRHSRWATPTGSSVPPARMPVRSGAASSSCAVAQPRSSAESPWI